VSHVTLAPHRPTSGGKPVKKKRRNSASTRVAGALRMAALSLRLSDRFGFLRILHRRHRLALKLASGGAPD
jgi:hypothetical protein